MTTVIDQFTVGTDDVRVGATVYSNNGRLEFYLNDYNTSAAVKTAISSITYIGGTTNTADGLQVRVLSTLLNIGFGICACV